MLFRTDYCFLDFTVLFQSILDRFLHCLQVDVSKIGLRNMQRPVIDDEEQEVAKKDNKHAPPSRVRFQLHYISVPHLSLNSNNNT